MGFIKKQAVGFYINALATIVAAAGLGLYLVNCRTAYFANLGVNTAVVVCFAVGIVLELVFIAGYQIKGRTVLLDLCPVACGVLFTVATINFISARVSGIAAIMTFTNNASTMKDLNQTIVSIVFCIAAMLLTMAGAFLKIVKEK